MKYLIKSKLSENISETPEGYLICLGVPVARTGEQEYGEGETPIECGANGKVIIYREESEVFRPQTLASFEGKSVTITHPEEFVDPSNWNDLTHGIMQNVRRGTGEHKDDILADFLITSHAAIELVKRGVREVSCGYEADYVQTEKGKGKQTNIVGNHVALVDQGRAGPAYAIKDHKGKGAIKMKDRIKAIFAKATDDALKVADEEKEQKKDDKKEESKDANAMDELKSMMKDMAEKVEALGKSKDEEKPAPKKEEKKEDESKDADKEDEKSEDEESPAESSLEERLAKLEAAVSKMLEGQAGDEDLQAEGTDEEEEESEDNDFEETTMVGDSADIKSRAEILAPGIKATKNVKAEALKQAYGTKDGKKAIDSINGGKAPAYDNKEKVDMIFVAASELLKHSRSKDLSSTKRKTNDFQEVAGAMTAEKMNEINSKHYKGEK